MRFNALLAFITLAALTAAAPVPSSIKGSPPVLNTCHGETNLSAAPLMKRSMFSLSPTGPARFIDKFTMNKADYRKKMHDLHSKKLDYHGELTQGYKSMGNWGLEKLDKGENPLVHPSNHFKSAKKHAQRARYHEKRKAHFSDEPPTSLASHQLKPPVNEELSSLRPPPTSLFSRP